MTDEHPSACNCEACLRAERFAFFSELSKRLDAGARAYADASFARPVPELLTELEQEALDLAGWGYVLWVRLQRLQTRAKAGESE